MDIQHNNRFDLGLWCLTTLSTIGQLYCGDQCHWWRKPEYQEKTTDLSQVISERVGQVCGLRDLGTVTNTYCYTYSYSIFSMTIVAFEHEFILVLYCLVQWMVYSSILLPWSVGENHLNWSFSFPLIFSSAINRQWMFYKSF